MTFFVLHIDWHNLMQLELGALCEGLPTERRHRIHRYRKMEDKYRSVLAGHLAICLFQRTFPGRPLPDIRAATLNRPYFAEWPGFDFNLSHSGEWVAGLASTSGSVGVDLERIVPRRDILVDVLSVSERVSLEGLIPSAQAERFTTLWTLKEAYAKAIGEGLRMDFSALAFDVAIDGQTAALRGDTSGRPFRIFRLDHCHICSVCHDLECSPSEPLVLDAVQFLKNRRWPTRL